MRLLASSRFRLSAAVQAGARCRFLASLVDFLAAFLRRCEACPSIFFARPWCLVAPAAVSRLWAWAIDFATAGGIGPQRGSGVRRQVAASRPVTGSNTQPPAGSQESVVQGLASSQTLGVPAQIPAWQASFSVQRLPSLHGVPSRVAGSEQVPVSGSQTPVSWH